MTARLSACAAGLVVLTGAWVGPLPAAAANSFAAHMALHMTVVAIAAPLLAYGTAGSRWDPVVYAPIAFAPIPASLVELGVVSAWHSPVLHHAARHSSWMFALEQASFLAAGLFFWCSIAGGVAAQRSDRSASGVIALALTFAHMTLLGALLALTPRPLYHGGNADAWAAAMADQQLGGTVMLAASSAVYITAGLWLSRGLLRQSRLVRPL